MARAEYLKDQMKVRLLGGALERAGDVSYRLENAPLPRRCGTRSPGARRHWQSPSGAVSPRPCPLSSPRSGLRSRGGEPSLRPSQPRGCSAVGLSVPGSPPRLGDGACGRVTSLCPPRRSLCLAVMDAGEPAGKGVGDAACHRLRAFPTQQLPLRVPARPSRPRLVPSGAFASENRRHRSLAGADCFCRWCREVLPVLSGDKWTARAPRWGRCWGKAMGGNRSPSGTALRSCWRRGVPEGRPACPVPRGSDNPRTQMVSWWGPPVLRSKGLVTKTAVFSRECNLLSLINAYFGFSDSSGLRSVLQDPRGVSRQARGREPARGAIGQGWGPLVPVPRSGGSPPLPPPAPLRDTRQPKRALTLFALQSFPLLAPACPESAEQNHAEGYVKPRSSPDRVFCGGEVGGKGGGAAAKHGVALGGPRGWAVPPPLPPSPQTLPWDVVSLLLCALL